MRPGEPVYAQVNRDKKRSRGGVGPGDVSGYDYSEHAHHWMVQDNGGAVLDTSHGSAPAANNSQGGDSWVWHLTSGPPDTWHVLSSTSASTTELIQQVILHQRNVIERSEPLQLHLICDLIQFMNLVMKIFNLFLMQHYVSINHETQILPRIKSDISKYVKWQAPR